MLELIFRSGARGTLTAATREKNACTVEVRKNTVEIVIKIAVKKKQNNQFFHNFTPLTEPN